MEARLHRGGLERHEDEPEFPELDGPVFLLGGCALVDAVEAMVGEDPLSEVLGVLLPVLDGLVPGLDGQVVADALIGAFAEQYRCELPGDTGLLQRIGRPRRRRAGKPRRLRRRAARRRPPGGVRAENFVRVMRPADIR